MQSPAYDPAQEYEEAYTDWEGYCSDEYYDCIPINKPKSQTQLPATGANSREKPVSSVGLKRKSAGQPTTQKKRKRRKLESTEHIPELSLGESWDSDGDPSGPCSPTSIVIWKTEETFTPLKWPIVGDMDGEKVALLKDWRERFKIAPRPDVKDLSHIAEEKEVEKTKKSKASAARVIHAADNTKVGNGGRSLKRQASSAKEDAEPRKRALPSRQAVQPAARRTSKLPTATRKRKAEEALPEADEETDSASGTATTAGKKTIRNNFAVVIPSRNAHPATGQRKDGAPEPAQSKTNGVASATDAGTVGGTGTRRSKRSKPG